MRVKPQATSYHQLAGVSDGITIAGDQHTQSQTLCCGAQNSAAVVVEVITGRLAAEQYRGRDSALD